MAAVGPSLQAALTCALPLGDDTPPLRLAELAGQARAELGFLAPAAEATVHSGSMGGALADLLAPGTADDQRMAAWLRAMPPGAGAGLPEGMLTGFIDLLFEHDGRLWILDWKSNRLPDTDSPAEQLMAMQGYGLQALFYALAARRLLALRGRNPDQTFGGVLYVFLRAFGAADAETALQRGLICCRPSAGRLAAAEQYLFAAGELAP
jgi:exodeoxyribonuclease V beta subunit